MTLLRATAGPPLSAAEQPGRRGHCAVSSSCSVHRRILILDTDTAQYPAAAVYIAAGVDRRGWPVCVQSAVPLAGDVVMI